MLRYAYLGVAQLVARSVRDAEVACSSQVTQTRYTYLYQYALISLTDFGLRASQVTQTIFYAIIFLTHSGGVMSKEISGV